MTEKSNVDESKLKPGQRAALTKMRKEVARLQANLDAGNAALHAWDVENDAELKRRQAIVKERAEKAEAARDAASEARAALVKRLGLEEKELKEFWSSDAPKLRAFLAKKLGVSKDLLLKVSPFGTTSRTADTVLWNLRSRLLSIVEKNDPVLKEANALATKLEREVSTAQHGAEGAWDLEHKRSLLVNAVRYASNHRDDAQKKLDDYLRDCSYAQQAPASAEDTGPTPGDVEREQAAVIRKFYKQLESDKDELKKLVIEVLNGALVKGS